MATSSFLKSIQIKRSLGSAASTSRRRGAFAALVRDASPSLERLALRMLGHREDAEDATQEAVLYAWRRLDSFRGEAAFGTWLHRILV